MELLFVLAVLALLIILVVIPMMISSLHGKSNIASSGIDAIKNEINQLNKNIDQLNLQVKSISLSNSKILKNTTVVEVSNDLNHLPSSDLVTSQTMTAVKTTHIIAEPPPKPIVEPIPKSIVEPPPQPIVKPVESVTQSVEKPTTQPINKLTTPAPTKTKLDSSNEITRVQKTHLRTREEKPVITEPKTQPAIIGIILSLWSWFTKENPLAKVGIILLFLGLSYLLKYSIEHQVLSIEWRLMGAMLIGMTLLGFGWYLRKKQTLYALILQGGAIGTLYITTFAAFRLYDLIPHLFAFSLMLLICTASVSLAILQRAMSLAVVASLGGYLAPILLSTGGGSHIGLFSYYLLISSGILVISIWQSWRILNLIGFGFTFGIAMLWGIENYKPEFYLECQLFLIANLLIYGVLAVILSLRSQKKEQYQTIIDTVLLFGAPLSGFSMQYHITQIWEFGPAFSALGFGLFYLIGAFIILRRWSLVGRNIALYGLAIGSGFTTLSIPLALSAEWTSLAWLFEGLAILWVGLLQRQHRFAWIGSTIMALGLLAIFKAQMSGMTNASFLMIWGCLSISSLIAAGLWYFYRPEKSFWNSISHSFATIAILAWLYWINFGIQRVVSSELSQAALLILAIIGVSVWIWRELGRRLKWQALRYCSWILWPFLILSLSEQIITQEHILQSGFWNIAWLIALISAYLLIQFESQTLPLGKWIACLPISLFWITLLLIANELVWYTNQLSWGMEELSWAILVTYAALSIGIIYLAERRFNWLDKAYREIFWQIGLLPSILFLIISLITGLKLDGQMVNWLYIPFINPLEEAAIFAWLMLAIWNKRIFQSPLLKKLQIQKYTNLALIIIAALWANSALLKALSYYGNINWNVQALWNSNVVQATFALVWTLTSLVMMIWATHKKHRYTWLVGASLLFVVIIKLLLIDSVNTGGLARAITFIGVAILVLIVGYFSPLPPKKSQESL